MLVAPEHIRRVAPDDVFYPGGRDDITVALEQLALAREHLARDEHDEFDDQRVAPEEAPVPEKALDQQWQAEPPADRDPDDPDEWLFDPREGDGPRQHEPQNELTHDSGAEPLRADDAAVSPDDGEQGSKRQAEQQPTMEESFRKRRSTFAGLDIGDFGAAQRGPVQAAPRVPDWAGRRGAKTEKSKSRACREQRGDRTTS